MAFFPTYQTSHQRKVRCACAWSTSRNVSRFQLCLFVVLMVAVTAPPLVTVSLAGLPVLVLPPCRIICWWGDTQERSCCYWCREYSCWCEYWWTRWWCGGPVCACRWGWGPCLGAMVYQNIFTCTQETVTGWWSNCVWHSVSNIILPSMSDY